MSWKSNLTWDNAQKRARILHQIRQFFAERNVVEVETPALSQGTVTDVHLEAFSCRYDFLADSSCHNSKQLFLQTSPEFHMKRLLASGYGCIYQIAKAFRYEESGRYHNPEFTMLEWYRLGFDQFDLMDEVAALLKTILACPEPIQMTYQQAFIQQVGIDPLVATREQLLSVITDNEKLSDWLVTEDNCDILLQFIFSEIIEPHIGNNEPCFVYNYPKTQASLAKICPKDKRVAQRFECYYHGVELVNGFNELTSAKEQIMRFQRDNLQRHHLGLNERDIDQNFISALSHGLPQCSGVALGVDRLVMLALNVEHIENAVSFTVENS